MRKIAAFVLCTFLVLTLSFAFIHPSFLLLANWLSPMIGSSLLTALSMIFLLLGDPIKFVTLALLWGGVALLGGIIIRRRVGAVVTMLLVVLLMIPILATSIYEITMTVIDLGVTVGSENPMDFLPPLPSGLTIAQLYEAPIIGGIAESALGMFQGGEPPSDPQQVLTMLVSPILFGIAVKLVIIIVGALVGVEVGRLVEPAFKPVSESLRVGLGGKPRRVMEEISNIKENYKSLFLALVIISASLLALPSVIAEESENFYTENILGYADSSGRGYVGNLFVGRDTSMEDIVTEGLLTAIILSQEGVKEALPELLGMDMEGLESFANMIPPTLMVTAYVDVPPELAGVQSEGVSSAFSSAYGVDLSQFMVFEAPLPMGSESGIPPITIVLYQSTADLEDLSETYLDQFLDNGGLIELINEASANGRLIPGATSESADGSVLLSGFVNLDTILEYLPEDVGENITSFIPDGQTGLLGLSGGVSFWDRGVESEEAGFDLLSLLGVKKEADFSEESDMSLVLLAAPNGTDVGGEESAPNVKITTSLPLDDPKMEFIYEMLRSMGLLTITAPGEGIDSSSFQIDVQNVVLPIKIEVSKTVSTLVASPKESVQVTVTVNNQDTLPMKDVRLDDTSSLSGYSLSARLISGTTSERWSEIGPGQSRSISYTVELGQGGVYSLSPASLTYTNGEMSFSDNSDWLEITVSHPSAISLGIGSILSTIETMIEGINMVSEGNGVTILMSLGAIVFLILAVLEFKNFRKWIG